MATCWHCKDRPTDPKRAKKVTLHKACQQRTIEIPICGPCADVLRRRTWATTGIVLLGVVIGPFAVGALGAPIWAPWALAVGVAAVVVVVRHRITAAAGYEAPGPHPQVTRLVDKGWSLGSAPTPSSYQQKTCSKCRKSIPLSAHAGQRCPHCGAYWSYENEQVVR